MKKKKNRHIKILRQRAENMVNVSFYSCEIILLIKRTLHTYIVSNMMHTVLNIINIILSVINT